MPIQKNNANESDDMGYNVPYVPIDHEHLGWRIVETKQRDTRWDIIDPTGRLAYRPSQRQYNLIRPDGHVLTDPETESPQLFTRYGAALHTIFRERGVERDLLVELVTGPATSEPEYELIDRMD